MKCHPQIFLFYMNMYGMYFITSTLVLSLYLLLLPDIVLKQLCLLS
ncbi:putative membrane protein [Clostridioides difficile P28]|nr:putative membrane protein [Clostridioides difficile P28]